VTSATSRTRVHNAAFPACQTPGFIGETVGRSVQCEYGLTRGRSQEFAVSSEVSSRLEATSKVK
jgi:hypothetical protein